MCDKRNEPMSIFHIALSHPLGHLAGGSLPNPEPFLVLLYHVVFHKRLQFRFSYSKHSNLLYNQN